MIFYKNGNSFQNTQETTTHNTSSSESNSPSSFNPEMFQNLMKMFSNSSSESGSQQESQTSNFSGIDINMLLKIKSLMDKMQSNKDDPRANLLRSLKPYLKESRKSKVDQYVQFFGMAKAMELFQENGGEKIQ